MGLLDSFRRVLDEAALVNGSFFTRSGMALAADGIADRIAPRRHEGPVRVPEVRTRWHDRFGYPVAAPAAPAPGEVAG